MTVTVEVDLEAHEVVDQLTDAELAEEVERRKLGAIDAAALAIEIREAFHAHDERALEAALDKLNPDERVAERAARLKEEYDHTPRWSC